ncbi:ankryin [Acidobacteria bacterium AB60]|nr:ankryin [Acidobacteria bacterium AB60]
MASVTDPISAFLVAACVPLQAHNSGTTDEAEAIRARYPQVAQANIYTAAALGDHSAVRAFLVSDGSLSTKTGGPYGWDALTHLCFSRYLRLDRARSEEFVQTARLLLDAGASANTGFHDKWDNKPIFESVIYGAAGAAQHPGMTRLLLQAGADPNDEETCYHAPENYDNTVVQILLESGKLNERSKSWILVRKADWHDIEGIKLALDHGADPNYIPRWGNTGLQQAVQRDNRIQIIRLLLERGGDPLQPNAHGMSAAVLAARRGRGDVVRLLMERHVDPGFQGVDRLIAACALGEDKTVQAVVQEEPDLQTQLLTTGGSLLAHFAGVGNEPGVRCLLDLGVPVDTFYSGDGYFDIAPGSTALHVSAWRGEPEVTKLLLARGANVNALDGKGRSPLQRALLACTSSYWKQRRTIGWVAPLIAAGASLNAIEIPTGYDEADALLKQSAAKE